MTTAIKTPKFNSLLAFIAKYLEKLKATEKKVDKFNLAMYISQNI